MKKIKNKQWKVAFSSEATKKLNEIPDEVHQELERIIKGFKTGKLNPKTLGQPVDYEELFVKLECPECTSKEVEWLLDKNSEEVTFHCLKCSESFWMTHEEYKGAVSRNKDKVIN